MDRLILAACCVTAITMWPLLVKAELDLADYAGTWVSSMRSGLAGVDDRWEGPASLHDHDQTTAYLPPINKPFEIHLRLHSSTGEAVNLKRLVVTGLESAIRPAAIEFGGMVLQVDEQVAATEGAETRVDLSSLGAGTLLRLSFAPVAEDAGIADISVYAIGPAPGFSPPPRPTPWLGGLAVNVDPVSGASHFEISRIQGQDEFRFILNPGVHQSWDRPHPGRAEYRVRTVGFDGSTGAWSEATVVEFAPPPPRPGIFGVVEGFYGRPWTWTERLESLRFMAALGMNTYVYAPKDDPFHRKEWTEAYPASEMRRFAQLLEVGRAVGVEVTYALSPGLTIRPYLDRDFDRLTAKLEPFVTAGCRSFALCLDDIKVKTDAKSGRAHASLTAKLKKWLDERDSKLMMVGTVYFATPWTKAAERVAYLKELGWMPPEVPIMWTGEGVFDAVMAPTHAKGVGKKFIRRKPLVWDNYPVNDFYYRSRRLFLGPVTGREAALLDEISGLLVNPMTHQVASRPAMLSYGMLFSSPAEYAPALAPEDLMLSLEAVGDPSPYELLVSDYSVNPKLHPRQPAQPELENEVARFLKALRRKDRTVVATAAEQLTTALATRYVGDLQVLAGARNPSLADELWAPLHKRRAQLELALAVVGVLASPGDVGAAKTLERLWGLYVPHPLGWRWYALDDALDSLLERVPDLLRKKSPEAAGRGTPRLSLPAEVHQGDLVELAPGDGAQFAAVYGEGATLKDNKVLWTPATPGYARLVLVQIGEGFSRPTCWRPFVHEAPFPR